MTTTKTTTTKRAGGGPKSRLAASVLGGALLMLPAIATAGTITLYNQDCREVASGSIYNRADFRIQGSKDLIGLIFGGGSCTDTWINNLAIGSSRSQTVDGGDCEYTVEARSTVKWTKYDGDSNTSLTCKEESGTGVCYCND